MSDIEIVGMQAVFSMMDTQLEAIETAVNEAVQGAGIECQANAKQLAPVDTGRLRSSIQYNPGHLECTVGTNVTYAPFVEFGVRGRAGKSFLFPAFELARRHLEDELRNL